MDCKITKNYLKEKARMTKSDENCHCSILCVDCPLSQFNNQEKLTCYKLESCNPDKAIAIVQKWSDEHPQKTYQDDFFEKFPNAIKDNDGTPKYCCKRLYGFEKDCNKKGKNILFECYECWHKEMPE